MAASTLMLLSDDLIFASRIEGTARALGLACVTVRSPTVLTTQASAFGPGCVILDLHNPGLEVAALVKQLKSSTSPPFIVGYGSHVDAATLKQAREKGCDLVLPRSQFVEDLPTCLPQWLG